MSKTIDVLVVGAGPVGLFCANELLRHGLQCRIIDKKSSLSVHSKALGLHIRTLDVMEDCGFLEAIEKQGHRINGAVFNVKGKPLMDLDFKNVGSSRDYLIDLPQNKTEAILNEALHNKGQEVAWNCELIDIAQQQDGVKATIQQHSGVEETVLAKWIIACDGAHSMLRHLLQEGFAGASYKQDWWLADLHIQWKNPENKMYIFVSDKGPLACFPMGEHRYRLVLTAPDKSEGNPTLADIDRVFKERTQEQATLTEVIWLSEFNIHHRQIKAYRNGRIFFAGDAAHIHSPMGGQGLNTGIQDIYNLVWKLAMYERGQAQEVLLDSYHAERHPIGRDVLRKTHVMTKMIVWKNPILIALRNALMKTLISIAPIKKAITRDLAELTINYAKSPVVCHRKSSCQLQAGQFIGDFTLFDTKTKKTVSIQTIIKGTKHHVLVFAGIDADNAQNQQALQFATHLQQRLQSIAQSIARIHGITAEQNADFPSDYLDKDQHTQKQLHIQKATVVIVRPDKYIGAILSDLNEENVMQTLQNMGLKI